MNPAKRAVAASAFVLCLAAAGAFVAGCHNSLFDTIAIIVEESANPLSVSFSPDPGMYTTEQSVTLTVNQPGASIRYTTDGSDPGEANGMLYGGAFEVSSSTVVKAMATKPDWSDSPVAQGEYTIPFGKQLKKYAITPANGDELGWSAAVSGDYAIVGAPGEDGGGSGRGAAYIFYRNGGAWDSVVRIEATNPTDGHRFGHAVAIDGDYAVVGTSYWTGQTSAYIFHRTGPGNAWDSGCKIDTPNPQFEGYFACSVAISGDYAVVGAYVEDGYYTDTGVAYVFHRTGLNAWADVVQLNSHNDAHSMDFFGGSVAIDGDYVIIGAPYWDSLGPSPIDGCGAAYVFYRTGPGNDWSGHVRLMALTLEDGAEFGGCVDIDGDYVIVGAQNEDIDVLSQAGAAYILRRIDTDSWEHSDHLTAPDAQTMDYFGDRVAISGDFALVGAKMEDGIADRSGSVYSFRRTAVNTWDQGPTAKIMADDGGSMQFFGRSVAVDGEYAVVGADGSDGPGGTPTDTGAAYVLR